MSTVKFQEENCSTVETKSCRPISEQVCSKGRRMVLHLGVFWDWHYNSMFFENWITCWCFLGMDSHLNVFWDWNYIWVFPEIGSTFGCFLRTELHLDVFLYLNYIWVSSEYWITFGCFLNMNYIWAFSENWTLFGCYLRLKLHFNCIMIWRYEYASKISEIALKIINRTTFDFYLKNVWTNMFLTNMQKWCSNDGDSRVREVRSPDRCLEGQILNTNLVRNWWVINWILDDQVTKWILGDIHITEKVRSTLIWPNRREE